jgi:hypothetical protein
LFLGHALRKMLRVKEGFSISEAEELSKLPTEEMPERISELRLDPKSAPISGRRTQRIVTIAEAEPLLTSGREVVTAVQDWLVMVEKPT